MVSPRDPVDRRRLASGLWISWIDGYVSPLWESQAQCMRFLEETIMPMAQPRSAIRFAHRDLGAESPSQPNCQNCRF